MDINSINIQRSDITKHLISSPLTLLKYCRYGVNSVQKTPPKPKHLTCPTVYVNKPHGSVAVTKGQSVRLAYGRSGVRIPAGQMKS